MKKLLSLLALGLVLSEIDEIAKATFSSITVATMLQLIRRARKHSLPS